MPTAHRAALTGLLEKAVDEQQRMLLRNALTELSAADALPPVRRHRQ